jgi:hypothetical protein
VDDITADAPSVAANRYNCIGGIVNALTKDDT